MVRDSFIRKHMIVYGIIIAGLIFVDAQGAIADDTTIVSSTNELISDVIDNAHLSIPTEEINAPVLESKSSSSTASDATVATSTQTATTTQAAIPSFDEYVEDDMLLDPISAATTSDATSTPRMHLTCTMSYTADLYDTPSGHLDRGYVLAADATPATKKNKIAHHIGFQSWTVCHSDEGKIFEFKITPQEYAEISQHDARILDREI